MITRLIWTIWTPLSSVPKKANKLNLSLSASVLAYCELDNCEWISVKLETKYKVSMQENKFANGGGGHFVLGYNVLLQC